MVNHHVIQIRLKPKKTNNVFHNPYSYGSPQNEFGMITQNRNIGIGGTLPNLDLVEQDRVMRLGTNSCVSVSNPNANPNPMGIRNVALESPLITGENSRINPKQSGISMIELNRFEQLPWNPQEVAHIVFKNGMPRGGISTRIDKLENCNRDVL